MHNSENNNNEQIKKEFLNEIINFINEIICKREKESYEIKNKLNSGIISIEYFREYNEFTEGIKYTVKFMKLIVGKNNEF